MKFYRLSSVFVLLIGTFHLVYANVISNTVMLPGMVPQMMEVSQQREVPRENETLNVYQKIYNAYFYGETLDNKDIKKLSNFFYSHMLGENTKDKYQHQKKYFLMLIASNVDASFFNDIEHCKYDEESVVDRARLRAEIEYGKGDSRRNQLFKSFLMLDSFQDLGYANKFIDELKTVISNHEIDGKFHQYLKKWLDLIEGESEEQELRNFAKFTLIDAESKTWSVEHSERLVPFARALLFLGVGVAVYCITFFQITSDVAVISNSQNIFLTNVTTNDLILQNLSRIVLGPVVEINGTAFFSNVSAILYSMKMTTCSSPVNKKLAIAALVSVVVTFLFDVFLNISHYVMYYFYRLFFGLNIESIPKSIINELYDQSKRINGKEEKKSFMKSVGTYLGDKLKKTWTPNALIKDFRKIVENIIEKTHAGKKEN